MVVTVGLTFVEPLADVEVNEPGEMAMFVAPVVVQLSVLLEPELTPVGFAVKDEIVGTDPLPVGEFDEYPEAQPNRAAHPARAKISAHNSSPDGLNARHLRLFPYTE